jgi:hypothetical protein
VLAINVLAISALAIRALAIRALAIHALAIRALAIHALAIRALAIRALAIRALAIHALAIRALAIHALAISALAISALAITRGFVTVAAPTTASVRAPGLQTGPARSGGGDAVENGAGPLERIKSRPLLHAPVLQGHGRLRACEREIYVIGPSGSEKSSLVERASCPGSPGERPGSGRSWSGRCDRASVQPRGRTTPREHPPSGTPARHIPARHRAPAPRARTGREYAIEQARVAELAQHADQHTATGRPSAGLLVRARRLSEHEPRDRRSCASTARRAASCGPSPGSCTSAVVACVLRPSPG